MEQEMDISVDFGEIAQYIVVDTAVLPEIFVKVLMVKRLVADKSASSLSSACKKLGISRAAFYKYRDYVFFYDEKMRQKIVHFTITLQDRAGVLSSVLEMLSRMDANILTLNQSIPVDGVAYVTISLKMQKGESDPMTIPRKLMQLDGVVDVRLLSSE